MYLPVMGVPLSATAIGLYVGLGPLLCSDGSRLAGY